MKAVFDTNILIDYLNGIHSARQELLRFDSKAISLITYMDVSGAGSENHFTRRIRNYYAPISKPSCGTRQTRF